MYFRNILVIKPYFAIQYTVLTMSSSPKTSKTLFGPVNFI